MSTRTAVLSVAASLCILTCTNSASAGGHTWKIGEIYSNGDGTIQFIELKECCGGPGETGTAGHNITSLVNGKSFTLTSNVASPTSFKTILIATPAYAALPGVPTPNYILPAGSVPFFSPAGDTLNYVGHDSMTFGAGALPTNCRCSLHRNGAVNSVGLSTPQNYAGQTAFVDPCDLCPADISPDCGDNAVNINDLLRVIIFWGPCGTPTYCPYDCAPASGDGQVNINDLLAVIINWGDCN